MTERVKVNVAFQLEIPVKRDPLTDRILQPAELVAPYIDDYFMQIREMLRGNDGDVSPVDFPYAEYESLCKSHVEANEEQKKLLESNMAHRNEMAEVNRTKWLDSQDAECKELYGMSSREWFRLSWKDRDKIKQERGIVWDSGKWVVDPKLKKEG